MRRTGLPRPAPGADPAYAGLKARIIARTGHHYYVDKDDLLAERLHRRLRATARADFAAYAALLADGAAGEAEWASLEAEITVGETFFFRYAEQFQALRQTILPGLIAARAPERTLRVWSAGCSTGAEPYSLAILAREALGPALPGWRVSILGTDISAAALATARAAEYGRWALRTTPPEERLRYFTRLAPAPGARREGGYALRPEYRGMVRFARANLLELAGPDGDAAADPGEGFDLILCRNVLIYFDAETVAAVVRGLARRLRRGGWLLLGHAEPNPAFSGFLDPVSLPGTVAYRRREPAPPAAAAAPAGPAEPAPPPPAERVGSAGRSADAGRSMDASPARDAGPGDARRPRAGRAGVDDGGAGGGEDGGGADRGVGGAARRDGAPDALAAPDVLPAAGPPPDPPPDGGPGDAVGRVRALADAGETGAAWRALRAALDRDPTDAALRFYEGLVARTLGRDAEAERALRAALYLDRGFVMAHFHLGLLLVALGRPAEGARALDNAAALSQALPPDAALPEGGGALAADVAAGAASGAAAARAAAPDGVDP